MDTLFCSNLRQPGQCFRRSSPLREPPPFSGANADSNIDPAGFYCNLYIGNLTLLFMTFRIGEKPLIEPARAMVRRVPKSLLFPLLRTS